MSQSGDLATLRFSFAIPRADEHSRDVSNNWRLIALASRRVTSSPARSVDAVHFTSEETNEPQNSGSLRCTACFRRAFSCGSSADVCSRNGGESQYSLLKLDWRAFRPAGRQQRDSCVCTDRRRMSGYFSCIDRRSTARGLTFPATILYFSVRTQERLRDGSCAALKSE